MIFTYLKNNLLFILSVFLLFLFPKQGLGQNSDIMNTINASGNNISSSTGSISYSIGQVFFSNTENNTYQIAEGVQQSNLVKNSNTEDIDVPIDDVSPKVNVIIYPNPTTDFVTLTSDGLNFNKQLNSYQLYNYQGKLLKNNILKESKTKINLSHLSTGLYLLQVFVNESLWKTFKIIKQ